MNIAEYWNEKTILLENLFEGWQRKEEIVVRKIIIAKVMDIPEERISYYLKRDSWYLKFTLGDDSIPDRDLIIKKSIKEKAQKMIEDYFYAKDYEALCKIKGIDTTECCNRKEQVRECIKELVEDKVYKNLNKSDKALLDMLEEIYYSPIELFNPYVEESAGSETYYAILVEQWKAANEMAENISAQRNNMNNFYMSLMSILIGSILFSEQVLDANILTRTVLYSVILIMGAVCCNKWIAQIDNYGKLNGAKYDVINALEKNLPANVMLYEYLHTEQNARRSKVKINFSKQEKDIAKLFRVIVILVPLWLLVSTWGEYVWIMFQK